MLSSLPPSRPAPRSSGTGRSSSPQPLVPFDRLLYTLVEHCQNLCTGSLHLVSAERHAGSFTLNQGQIVGVRYACQQGERALAAMQGLTQVSYRFTERSIAIADFQSLPKTAEILRQLGWGIEPMRQEQKSPDQKPPDQKPPEQNTSAQSNPPNLQQLQQQTRQQTALEHLATSYLGPVAKLILQKSLRQTQEIHMLIQPLKRHIHNPKEAARFEQEAHELFP